MKDYTHEPHTRHNKRIAQEKMNSYIGKKINRITINNWYLNKKYYYFNYTCQCGTNKNCTTSTVYQNKIFSCGCYLKEWRYFKDPKPRNDIKPNGGSAANYVYWYYKRNALKRNVQFELSKETFLEITKQNCTYCEIAPFKKYKHSHHKNSGYFVYNGIDRLDNNKGYVKGNMTPCCFICNRAKGELTLDEFYQWIDRIKNASDKR